ncbi:hypothetical protein BGZ46_006609 [Entomortierella lignicola]|nr:hypothetical protein BGZ46_006609 [Entomortierella lignicola]
MLASVYRATTAKSVKSLVLPQLGSINVSSHNLVSRRFKSDALEEEDARAPRSPSEHIKTARGNFRKGDIYSPSDLNDSKPASYPPPPKPVDELKILNINPIVEYKNANLLSHYITPLGRIMSREQTGLSAKNQRRLTKAVRRARALCIISPTARLAKFD